MPASSLFIFGINFVLLSLSHASGKGYCGIIVDAAAHRLRTTGTATSRRRIEDRRTYDASPFQRAGVKSRRSSDRHRL